ncbi:MAG: hypothetical protein AAF732_19070 [Pseudomonadota bacterium]
MLGSVAVANADETAANVGDAAVTSFSGTRLPAGGVKPGADPTAETLINPDGTVLRVLDLSDVGGPPGGQPNEITAKLNKTAKDIGQVFGVAFQPTGDDTPPNIFAAATSLFGLHIVVERDGKLVRLVKGEPGATWMPGQFGFDSGGTPGTIWKIDGETGKATPFADIQSGANPNAGPGLGTLAYHTKLAQLFVPNLETGYIHRLNSKGETVEIFDHGTTALKKAGEDTVAYDPTKRVAIDNPAFDVEDPKTWGYAKNARLVVAVTIHDNRLYYSVAEGPQIWSVGLDEETGAFEDDARLELDLGETASDNMVTGIVFDGDGKLYLSQRGAPTGAFDYGKLAQSGETSILRFSWDEAESEWSQDVEEYAVGKTPPHRATNGAIALGYGYDDDGEIDTKTCNATVWTTGDNLNGGSDANAVNGVQAMPTNAAQPQPEEPDSDDAEEATLEPPDKTWILDIGTERLGADTQGHVGAIAIFKKGCPGEIPLPSPDDEVPEVSPPVADLNWPELEPDQEPPEEFPEDGPPEIGMPGLDIDKSCAPAAIGGLMSCTITVENTGTEPLPAPIVVNDTTTVAAGSGVGTLLPAANVLPDGPGWTCTPTPTTGLSCGLPADLLPPGESRSFTVQINTANMVANGQVGFLNCARFGAPYWGTACDNGGTDISIKKTAQAGCVAGGPCTFNIEISNNASQAFTGVVRLTDQMFRGAVGPAQNGAITAGANQLGCIGGPPASIPFSCNANLNLAGNQTKSVSLTVTMPAAPPANYWTRNCIAVTSPGAPAPNLVNELPPGGGTLGTGGALSCVWVKVGNPGPHSNLKMSKAPTTEKCTKAPGDPDTVKCDFEIKVENTGPSDFNAVVNIDETVDPASELEVNGPGWSKNPPAGLAPGGTFQLSSVGPRAIAAGSSITIPVTVLTPRTVVEATGNGCQVINNVTLTGPAVNPFTNYNGADDTATAEGDAFLLEGPIEDGGLIILCDPANIVVSNLAKGPCRKQGDAWRCAFEVGVSNTGPDPVKGKYIKLADTLSIGSITEPKITGAHWTKDPVDGLYTLNLESLPDKELKVNAPPVKFTLTVDIPDGEYCSVTNTAALRAPLGKRFNSETNDDKRVAMAVIPRPECKRPPVCTPKKGEFRTPSGVCACQRKHIRSANGQCVLPEPTKPDEPEEVTCLKGMEATPQGTCQCPDGTRWNGRRCFSGDTVIPQPPELNCGGDRMVRSASVAARYRRTEGYTVRRISNGRDTAWCVSGRREPPPPPQLVCRDFEKMVRSASVAARYRRTDGYRVRRISNGRDRAWCVSGRAEPPPPPPLECRAQERMTRSASVAARYRRTRGYTVRPISNGRERAWCISGRPVPPPPPPLTCRDNEKMVRSAAVAARYRRTKGYTVRRISNGRERAWCVSGRREPPPPQCNTNERTVRSGVEARRLRARRYTVRRIAPRVWCARPPVAPPKPPCVGGQLNRTSTGGYRCVCGPDSRRIPIGRAGGARCERPTAVQCIGGRAAGRRCICPRGTRRVSVRRNVFRCVPQACPRGMVGRPPNCRPARCPRGMVGRPPNCRPARCPRGMVGRPPNCRRAVCPPGTVGRPPRCRPAKCPQGMVGRPPDCRRPVIR